MQFYYRQKRNCISKALEEDQRILLDHESESKREKGKKNGARRVDRFTDLNERTMTDFVDRLLIGNREFASIGVQGLGFEEGPHTANRVLKVGISLRCLVRSRRKQVQRNIRIGFELIHEI